MQIRSMITSVPTKPRAYATTWDDASRSDFFGSSALAGACSFFSAVGCGGALGYAGPTQVKASVLARVQESSFRCMSASIRSMGIVSSECSDTRGARQSSGFAFRFAETDFAEDHGKSVAAARLGTLAPFAGSPAVKEELKPEP